MKKDMKNNENATANKANEGMDQVEGKTENRAKEIAQQYREEFREINEKERKEEEEKTLQDIATSKEVIDALFQVREVAEKAAAHMEGEPAEGEDYIDILPQLKRLNIKSAQDFLEYVSLVGQKEARKKKRKEDHKSPYTDFIQLNNEKMDSLINLVDENPQAMKILLFIMQNMDGYNALVCSYMVLQERFGISHATVWRHIKYLRDHGYIHALKTGTSKAYVLSPKIGWRSYGKNVQYCKFPANVMISYNEQKEKEGESKIKRKKGRVELKEKDPDTKETVVKK